MIFNEANNPICEKIKVMNELNDSFSKMNFKKYLKQNNI